MKRTDYYFVYGTLLIVGLGLLIFTEEKVFAWVFLWVFIAWMEKLIGVEKWENIEEIKNDSSLSIEEKNEAREVFRNL